MKKLIVFCLFALTSCVEPINNGEVSSRISYYKDSRTNLCFAIVNAGEFLSANNVSIACVPCTEEVNKLIR